eukprot:m.838826 g.838826  ORF g.838826 m.838826 type:complete len:325 (+) comp23465_c0_seq15:138-1112(+)
MMVRVLFIRHGMTKGNLRDARMAIDLHKGNVKIEEVPQLKVQLAESDGPGELAGDTALSDLGLSEAKLLAEYWAPILDGKAKDGHVHAFVSPMRRCLQTADPIVTALGLNATILPSIMEVHGLCDPTDFKYLTGHIIPKSRTNAAAATQEWREYHWKRVGLSRQQIERDFPWSSGGLSALPREEGWYRGGFETPLAIQHRIQAGLAWIKDLAHQYDENDVVILVSHGDTIWRLLSGTLGMEAGIEHNIQNTSVSSIVVHRNGACALDFINRTPHLVAAENDNRNISYYEFMNIKKRKPRSGKQVNLSKVYRSQEAHLDNFYSKL